jgi:hypothetical protein
MTPLGVEVICLYCGEVTHIRMRRGTSLKKAVCRCGRVGRSHRKCDYDNNVESGLYRKGFPTSIRDKWEREQYLSALDSK